MDIPQLISMALRLNIVGENAYIKRFIGFKSELYFAEYLQNKQISYLKGGFCIPPEERKAATNNFIYYTVLNSTDNIEDYVEIYQAISLLDHNRLFIIKYYDNNIESWTKRTLHNYNFPVPEIKILEFINGKFEQVSDQYNYLFNCFKKSGKSIRTNFISPNIIRKSTDAISFVDQQSLLDIYVTRLIFDVILGMNIIKGVPADIDFIIKNAEGKIHFVETKEKDLAKRTKGFGLDKHRIEGMKIIHDVTGIPYYLIVREVNNQTDRKLINWWSISIDHFTDNMQRISVPGGHGMRSEKSVNPTFICPIRFFRKL